MRTALPRGSRTGRADDRDNNKTIAVRAVLTNRSDLVEFDIRSHNIDLPVTGSTGSRHDGNLLPGLKYYRVSIVVTDEERKLLEKPIVHF